MKISFNTSSLQFNAQFNNSQTAKEIIAHLPIESTISKWGDEIYFNLGFKACADNATMDVAIGDIAYWPQGKCLCIFFGLTPASNHDRPEPASPVVIIGKTNATAEQLRQIELGEKICMNLIKE